MIIEPGTTSGTVDDTVQGDAKRQGDKRIATVIGGGLVGLVVAIFLARRGYEVHVYELRGDPRYEQIALGSSIALTLTERGLSPLNAVGLEVQTRAELATSLRSRAVHDIDGSVFTMPYGITDEQVLNSVARADLHLMLVQAAAKEPNIELRFGQRFVAGNCETGEMCFEDVKTGRHQSTSADLIVGSDGVHSAVRGLVHKGLLASMTKTYVPYRYTEVTLDAAAVDRNSLHIWPRGEKMAFALPTRNGVNAVVVLPQSGPASVESLKQPEDVLLLFKQDFPDIADNAPRLVEEVLGTTPSGFATVRTDTWVRGRVVLVGDAAHAVTPFYGQGVNCGFEDALALDAMLGKHWHDQSAALAEYQAARRPQAEALADLSIQNFDELRDTVRDPRVAARKRIDLAAQKVLGTPSLYTRVAHSTIPYADCVALEQRRHRITRRLGADVAARGIVIAGSARRLASVRRGNA